MKRNLLKSIFTACFMLLSCFAYSQIGGVSVNKTNIPADPSAMLDVSSTSPPYMGMLIPRMTTANRNAITLPATGLQIFNTDCGVNEYYTGTCWISMGQNMKLPDPITCSGTTDFCANETRSFSIPIVNGATSYLWIAPAGASITSGQGSTSVTVVFGNNSGQVCVNASNLCETSPVRCTDIHINPVPLAPGNITGPTMVAPGTAASYFIAAVAGAGVYNWTVPAGATITSGVSTTSITVSFSCNAVSDNVSVTAQNNCGSGTASSLAITLTPLTASAVPIINSPGILGGSPTASGGAAPYIYAWLPSTNLSSTTVANPTTTICTTQTYTVTVTDANGCIASSSTTASAVNPIPATPGPIAGNANVSCSALSGNVYSISPIIGASTYTWTVPSVASITAGQGTNSITVTFGGSSGNITVTAGNNCGTSSANSLAITISGSGGSGSQTFNATSTGANGTIQSFTVPSCITSVTIEAWGAQGGTSQSGYSGGLGAYMKGTFSLSAGTVVSLLAGQKGTDAPGNLYYGGGGGGGSFVVANGSLLIAAGGGGGASGRSTGPGGGNGTTSTSGNSAVPNSSQSGACVAAGGTGGAGGRSGDDCGACGGCNGSGGGGYSGDGGGSTNGGGIAYLNGGNGGNASQPGGFGGGGASGGSFGYHGGGGGGYSGGGGGQNTGSASYGQGGGGGGSYNVGTSQINTAGVRSGPGQIVISW